MSDVSSVTNHFPTANEGFITTVAGSNVAEGATVVGLASVAGLTDGSVFVGIVEPNESNEQVFTGIVDTAGVQITDVVWTRGTNAVHPIGSTIVDYVTGTGVNMTTKGILVSHDQDGTLKAGAVDNAAVLADDVVTTAKIDDGAVTPDKLTLGAASSSVDTSETTTSTSPVDLATVQSVTVTVGASGMALVAISYEGFNNASDSQTIMGYALSGANTLAASFAAGGNYIRSRQTTANAAQRIGMAKVLTGLTPGSTTFTAKFGVTSNTGTFRYRNISVVPL